MRVIGILRFLPIILIAPLLAGCAASSRATGGASQTPLAGPWLLEITSSDIGYVRTVVDVEGEGLAFEGHSRQGDAGDILGWWDLTLGKLFTDYFENGALLHLKQGKLTPAGDGYDVDAVLVSALGSMRLRGEVQGGRLTARLSANGEPRGGVVGVRNIPALPLDAYPALADSAILLAERSIYNRGVTTGSEWLAFAESLREISHTTGDDLAFIFGFFYNAKRLPFSHFYLYRKPAPGSDIAAADTAAGASEEKAVDLKILPNSVAHLRITTFAGGNEEIDSAFREIIAGGYRNLIIDLRGNTGGNLSAMRVASYLADSAYYGGVFVTNRWFTTHGAPPTVAEYARFPVLSEANTDLLFNGIHREEGLSLRVIPEKRGYDGNVVVLTDGATASACEPLVYGIREYHLGRVVGERTAGAMLNGEEFPLQGGWFVTIPTAEYYAADGYRIDRRGVEPDIKVDGAKALDYALANMLR